MTNGKLRYALIATDIDGTLLRSDKTVSAFTRSAIKKFVEAGGRFCLASGRMTPSVRMIAEDLGVSGAAISYAGAEITDFSNGKTLYRNVLSATDAAEIAAFMEEDGVHLQYYSGDKYYVVAPCELLSTYEKSNRVKGIVTGEVLSQRIRRRGEEVNKVLAIIDDPKRHAELLEKYTKKFGERFWVTRSTAKYIEVFSKTCNKGVALRFVAEYYGVPIERTIAAGDQLNDKEMLLAAGKGFCVKNGSEELKKIVAEYPETNDGDAVGKMIEEYAFL